MMTFMEANNVVRALLPQVPKKACGYSVYGSVNYRSVQYPLVEQRDYRGRVRCLVGYKWVRPYSHSMRGRSYPCVMGWGDTWEEAIAMMKGKLEKS